jgi:hypothetical protein
LTPSDLPPCHHRCQPKELDTVKYEESFAQY